MGQILNFYQPLNLEHENEKCIPAAPLPDF